MIGLKSQSTAKKVPANEEDMDAFDVELKVNNEFGVPNPESVDNLRSIGSACLNQGIANNMQNLNQGSPLRHNNLLHLNNQYSRM